MVKNTKFYIKNAMFGAILLVLGTAMVFTTTVSAPVPAAAARPPNEGGCDAGTNDGEPRDNVFVFNGELHSTTNDNGIHQGCHGQAEFPPTSGGARVDREGDCMGVATPSGNGNFVCNIKR